MKIWLLTASEPWPSDGDNPRLLRTGVMARRYAAGGDDITWFNTALRHGDKQHRFDRTTTVVTEPGLTIVGLYGMRYTRNISFARIVHNIQVAAEFSKVCDGFPRPDIIVASWPIPELVYAGMRYATRQRVPVVVDIRDLWPDIWAETVPEWLRGPANLAFWPYRRMLTYAVDHSAAICGTAEPMVQWALERGNRPRNEFDAALPLAREDEIPESGTDLEAEAYWRNAGIGVDPGKLLVCYFGALSKRYEFKTVFDALESMPEEVRGRFSFVICGRGEAAEELKRRAGRLDGIVHLPGFINAPQIRSLIKRSAIGLLPYPSSLDYVRSMPNKTYDYLTGGLPILTSLTGATGDFVVENGCGWLYRNNDPRDLANLLIMLANNPGSIAEASVKAARVATGYSADTVYGEFRQRLARIAAQAEAAPAPVVSRSHMDDIRK